MAKKQSDEEGVTPVTSYVPNAIVKQIDETAAQDRRSRSTQIVVLVEEALTARGIQVGETAAK